MGQRPVVTVEVMLGQKGGYAAGVVRVGAVEAGWLTVLAARALENNGLDISSVKSL